MMKTHLYAQLSLTQTILIPFECVFALVLQFEKKKVPPTQLKKSITQNTTPKDTCSCS